MHLTQLMRENSSLLVILASEARPESVDLIA